MSYVLDAPYRVLVAEANSPEWLRGRLGLVGASESAAVLGDSAWGTAITVAEQKWATELVDHTTDLMEFGHLAEPLIEAFLLAHPDRYGWMGEILPSEGLLQSISWPWLGGTLDRQCRTIDAFGNVVLVPLEMKSVNDFVISEWVIGGSDDDEDAHSYAKREYHVPKKYQVQVQQQMAVTGAPFAFVAVWLGKSSIEVIRVERDEAYIAEYLIGKVGDFWNYYVIPHILPPATLYDDLWKIWPGDAALGPITADTDIVDTVGQWRIATTDARDLKKEIAQMKFDITNYMGDHTEMADPISGEIIHTLKPQNTARGTDFDLLQTKHPDVYDEVIRPAGRTRVHRATKVKI